MVCAFFRVISFHYFIIHCHETQKALQKLWDVLALFYIMVNTRMERVHIVDALQRIPVSCLKIRRQAERDEQSFMEHGS